MNLYVANLSYNVSDQDLNELFSAFGNVTSAKVINDRETGRSRGFGFVEMSSKEEGNKAIAELNNTNFQGKAISVSEARPRTERPQGNFNRGGGGGGGRGGGGYGSDRRSNKW